MLSRPSPEGRLLLPLLACGENDKYILYMRYCNKVVRKAALRAGATGSQGGETRPVVEAPPQGRARPRVSRWVRFARRGDLCFDRLPGRRHGLT